MGRVFDIKLSGDKKVLGFYKKAMKELNDFYGIDWSENIPNIFIVSDRKTFDQLYRKKTESWVVGSTMNSENDLYLLAPGSYKKDSCHKYSDEKFFMLIKHELSHLYSRFFFDSYNPKWFTEGIAIYSSGQLNGRKKPKKFSNFLDFFVKSGGGIYDESGFAFEVLVRKIGKKKLLNSMKKIKTPVTKSSFKAFFKENFDIDLTYKWFNANL